MTVAFGGICENDENCVFTPGAVCNSGRCECMNGMRIVNEQCSLGTAIVASVTVQVLLLFILKLVYC